MNKINLQMFDDVVIPEELDGISPETAQEMLKEITVEEPTKPSEEPKQEQKEEQEEAKGEEKETAKEEEKEEQATTDGEADTDIKQVTESGEHQIPYARFKEVNSQKKQLEAELAELRKKLDAKEETTEAKTEQKVEQKAEASVSDKRKIMEEVDNLATQKAAEIFGMSKEEVDALEYSDDFVLKNRFATAKAAEVANIMERARQIRENAKAKEAEQQTVYSEARASLNSMIDSERKELTESKYSEILEYGSNIILPSLSKAEQKAIIEANNRIVSGNFHTADVIVLRSIYEKAKAEYLKKDTKVDTPATNKVNVKEKIKQAKALPRASQVTGANDANAGNYTQEQLQAYLKGDWDKIPKDAQKILLGF